MFELGYMDYQPIAFGFYRLVVFIFLGSMLALCFLILGLYYWSTGSRKALIKVFAGINMILVLLLYIHFPRATVPSIVFYNLHNCAAVHFIEADNSSYLCSDRKDSTYIYMKT